MSDGLCHARPSRPPATFPTARFRDDPDCRVFLSTDAGGTGLNLQVADTVINLEVPWNPAVLEQRIAQVHRMGQQRPVQVFNLVTRDSIEERVLRSLAQKQSLFTSFSPPSSTPANSDCLNRSTPSMPSSMVPVATKLTTRTGCRWPNR